MKMTWEAIKAGLLSHYNEEYYFFFDPEGREACIIPRKYGYQKLLYMNAEELKRITVY